MELLEKNLHVLWGAERYDRIIAHPKTIRGPLGPGNNNNTVLIRQLSGSSWFHDAHRLIAHSGHCILASSGTPFTFLTLG